jgi:RNA polymerase sigma factor (sigma-70 family)
MGARARADRDPASSRGEACSRFEAFFRDQYREVVRLAHTVLGDFQSAQDVAQEVFVAAHRRFPVDPQQAIGWVRVAAVHSALNVLRSQRRRERRHMLVVGAVHAPSAEEVLIDNEARADVRRALNRIPRRSAVVLVLRHGGMSYVDIADALGIKVGHVGTLLRRAESTLCKEMGHGPRT